MQWLPGASFLCLVHGISDKYQLRSILQSAIVGLRWINVEHRWPQPCLLPTEPERPRVRRCAMQRRFYTSKPVPGSPTLAHIPDDSCSLRYALAACIFLVAQKQPRVSWATSALSCIDSKATVKISVYVSACIKIKNSDSQDRQQVYEQTLSFLKNWNRPCGKNRGWSWRQANSADVDVGPQKKRYETIFRSIDRHKARSSTPAKVIIGLGAVLKPTGLFLYETELHKTWSTHFGGVSERFS